MDDLSGRSRYRLNAREFLEQGGKFMEVTINSFKENEDPSGHRAAEIRYEIMQMIPKWASEKRIPIKPALYELGLITEAEKSLDQRSSNQMSLEEARTLANDRIREYMDKVSPSR
jgi:hypothetical protein